MNYKAENFRNQAQTTKQISNSDCVEISLGFDFSLRGLLDFMIGASNCLREMHFTQSYIAKKLGITREHTNRLLAKARKLGIVSSEYRHMTSCIYTLHHAFKDIDVRNSLKHLYKSCYYLPLSILMSLGDEMKSLSSMIGINQFNQKQYVEESNTNSGMSHKYEPNNKVIYNYLSTRLNTTSNSACNKPPPAERDRTGDIKSKKSRLNSHIKGLNLTEAGCIKLLAYPPSAIQAGLTALRSHKGEIRDPFVYFSKICLDYCKDNKIRVDWGICFNELRRKGYEKDAVGVDVKEPLLYYTEEELVAISPPKAPPQSRYKDDAIPKKRIFDKQTEARRSQEILAAPPEFKDAWMSDFLASVLGKNIKDAAEDSI
jgi:hypothetical protein